ncbi:Uncharacterised protein [Mycobacteroides abscessus subsp. abscessus]|nr:Uncharacterised protein [Mycobacteroides abscessus subsp. abscessus]
MLRSITSSPAEIFAFFIRDSSANTLSPNASILSAMDIFILVPSSILKSLMLT